VQASYFLGPVNVAFASRQSDAIFMSRPLPGVSTTGKMTLSIATLDRPGDAALLFARLSPDRDR
jgi:hypothetical protein